MADITTFPDSIAEADRPCLFLDEVRDLYLPGSVSKPEYIKVEYAYSVPPRPGSGGTMIETLAEGYFYADFDGRVSLDFRDAIRGLVDYYPDTGSHTKSRKWIRWTYGKSPSNSSVKHTFVFLASSAVKERITDIDYLAVPDDVVFWVNFFRPAGYKYEIGVEQSGKYLKYESYDGTDDVDRILSNYISVTEISVSPGKPFRFVVNLIPTDSGDPELLYRSPVYEIMAGPFQCFAFADRFGGYTSFPMSGTLELAPEYEFENARYSSGSAKVAGTCSPVFTQYTGGLTKKAAAALSELLMSDHIYHRVGSTWYRIIVESADIRFQTVDSMHYGSFSFRYADDMSLPDVF